MSIDLNSLNAIAPLLDQVLGSGAAASAADPSLNGTHIDKGDGTSAVFGLGQDDFFKLFLAQLQNQDPTQPMDNKDLMAQIGQFSMIDTLHQVQKALGGSQLAQASALIGRTVNGVGTDGQALAGVVDRLVQDSTGIYLVIGDKAMTPDAVSIVTSTNPAPTPGS